MAERRVPIWYVFVVAAVTFALTAAISFALIVQSQRKWCSLLIVLEAPDKPATTERGAKVAREIGNLSREFGCS